MKYFRMLAAGLCSAVLLCGSAIPAYAYSDGGNEEPPVVEETPAPEPAPTITPGEGFSEDGNLVTRDLLYDAATNKQFITVETSGGNTFYIVIDYDKPTDEDGEQYQTYFLNMVDEADLLALMEEEDADAYTAEKEAAAQAEQDKLKAEEEAKKAAEEAAAFGEEQPKENKVTKIASGFLGVVVLIALAAGGGFYAFAKQKQKKQAEKEALDPDANYTEDKGDFEIPTELTGVATEILDPRDTYADASQWEEKAKDLASRFVKNFVKYEGNEAGKALVAAGPKAE